MLNFVDKTETLNKNLRWELIVHTPLLREHSSLDVFSDVYQLFVYISY